MILSNIEMQAALESGRLVINPKPMPMRPAVGQKCPYDTHSVNLRLGNEISIPNSGPFSFDLMQGGDLTHFLSRNSDKQAIVDTGYPLKKSQFVLGRTLEYIALPIDHEENLKQGVCLAARIEGRSSVARCGVLVHFTAPTVHPGFDGTLTLEIINLGPTNFILRPGMPIAQLIVEEVRGIPFENPSVFKGQRAPEGRIQAVAPHA
jgi:dCTP deaminase